MTEPLPNHIKKDPIYSKVYNLVYREDMNANFLVLGPPGKGKSTLAIKMGIDLDPNFSVERICFSIEQMLKLVNEGDSKGFLKKGSVIILDEAAGSEEAADSRNAMSRLNKTISFFTTISRQKGLIIFYVTPLLSQLDKRLRLVGVTGVFVLKEIDRQAKMSKSIFYFCYASALSDKTMMPKPRVFLEEKGYMLSPYWVPMPENKELISEYRKLKDAFISNSTNRWQAAIVGAREKKERKSTAIDLPKLIRQAKSKRDDLIRAGKPNLGLIRREFGVGMTTAYDIKQALEDDSSI